MFSAGDNGPFVGNIGNQHKLVPFILIIQLNNLDRNIFNGGW